MEVNVAFILPKVFEAPENQALVDDEGTDSTQREAAQGCPKFDFEEVNDTASFEEPLRRTTRHIKPLFIKTSLNEVSIENVMLDNRAAVNVLSNSSV